MNTVFLQDFMTFDGTTSGVLRLQDGVLGFYTEEQSILFTPADSVNITAYALLLRVNRENETYALTRGVKSPKVLRSLLVTPSVEETNATRKTLVDMNTVSKDTLIAAYDSEKNTNEMWVAILKAAGFEATYKVTIFEKPSLGRRTLLTIGITATLLGIAAALIIRITIS